MTRFEKDFILKCLDYFKLIITSPEEIETAILSYSENRPSDPRYHSNSIISKDEYWTETDKLNFSAAVFESTARANFYFLAQHELTTLVSLATAYWQSNIVPLLSENTDPGNRINSITNNCSRILVQVSNEVPSDSLASVSMDNPYSFFTKAAAAGITALAIGVSLTLIR